MSEYLFSQFKSNEFEDLYQQLSEVLNIPQNKLCTLYEKMRKEFEIEGYPQQTLSRDIFCPSDKSFYKYYDEAWVVGVDIPSIFQQYNNITSKKRLLYLDKILEENAIKE